MDAQTTSSRTGAHKDVYEIINDKIITVLEQGTVPWQRPWTTGGPPMNAVTRRLYRGINVMLLSMLEYEHNMFLTSNQLDSIGGIVNDGERGHLVMYLQFPQKPKEDDTEADEKKRERPKMRYYTVFNIAQCTGIPAELLPEPLRTDIQVIPTCEYVINQMPNKPRIQHKEQSAYYDPLRDYINMPKQKTFGTDASYYSTLFHELVHSTGHRSRLDRKEITEMAEFGSEPYSFEELVAEIGTCYLQNYCGIAQEFTNSAAYIQGWLKKLKNDKRFIVSASNGAQKAVDYILNESGNAEEKDV